MKKRHVSKLNLTRETVACMNGSKLQQAQLRLDRKSVV